MENVYDGTSFGLNHTCSSDYSSTNLLLDRDQTDCSAMFDKTETAFLRQLCCDNTNYFVRHFHQVFVLTDALSYTH